MKFLPLVLVACSMASTAAAQKIRFTDPGNEWTFLTCSFDATKGTTSTAVSTAKWQGDSIFNGITYQKQGYLLFREDAAVGKIYFRFNAAGLDSQERVYFDYHLKTGDTLRFVRNTALIESRVSRVDSVLLGSVYHRVWQLQPALTAPNGALARSYTFIEGIGCTDYTDAPFTFQSFDDHNSRQLRCFSTHGVSVPCQPGIPVPACSAPVPQASGYVMVSQFDNTTSCAFTPLSVQHGSAPRQAAQFVPNPGGPSLVLRMPDGFQDGFLEAYNATGSLVFREHLPDARSYPVGQRLAVPGLYLCILKDGLGRPVYQDRVLFN